MKISAYLSTQAGQRRLLAGWRAQCSEHRAERSNGGGGSGSQEAAVHRQSATRGHAASVAQQEEDSVHHVLHFCRQDEVKSKGEGKQLTSSFQPQPIPRPRQALDLLVLVWTPASLTSELAKWDAIQHNLGLVGVTPVGPAHGCHHYRGIDRIHTDLQRGQRVKQCARVPWA